MAEPRVALVHDWLTGMRGGEKVLLELCRLFPNARIYTLLWNRGTAEPEIEERVRQTSFLQKLPRAESAYRNYLPLFPAAVRSLAIEDADLVLSSSHAVAKGVPVPPGVPHVSYVHTPMRYLWDPGGYFLFGRGRWWKRPALRLVSPYLRRFDLRTAAKVDYFIANSENVRGRIRRIYQAEAEVIPPPVDTGFFVPAKGPGEGGYDLVVSSLVPYKRIDLAIRAFGRLGSRLVVAGSGALRRELQEMAGPNIHFTGHVSDTELLRLYQNCRFVVFPGVEDFGIVPVEAQACGKPVICCGRGGATESVIDGETGIHFWPQDPEALIAAIRRAEGKSWNPERLRRQSLQFSRGRFRDRMKAFLQSRLGLSFTLPARVHDARHRSHSA